MSQKIIFTDTTGIMPVEVHPYPCAKDLPDWYKKTESYVNGLKKPDGLGGTTASIKKCVPVFDAITAGYLIPLPADVYVSLQEIEGEKKQWFEWASFELISFHPISQAPNHPMRNEHPYAKFNNPWSITTPKGFSSLIVQPFHRSSPFTILPGIVDTDSYHVPVNFPFVINDPSFEGIIEKGTPIAQVIPIKRENWEMTQGGAKEIDAFQKMKIQIRSRFFDAYKKQAWTRKEYK